MLRFNNECAIPFMSKVTPCPSVKNAIQPVSLRCQLVLSGCWNEVPHLEWRELRRSFKETALTAIASSVANITSTGYEGVMFDKRRCKEEAAPMEPAFILSPSCFCKSLSGMCQLKMILVGFLQTDYNGALAKSPATRGLDPPQG